MRSLLLLDTDILSLLRRGHERVTQHATGYIITHGRLAFTVRRSRPSQQS